MDWLLSHLDWLMMFGLAGQALFMGRFVAQWWYSEKLKRSAMPEVFWYFSIGGGLVLLVYSVLKKDVVFSLGQFLGLFIYLRNVYFIWRSKARNRSAKGLDTLEELVAHSASLLSKAQKGDNLSDADYAHIAEALHILRKDTK